MERDHQSDSVLLATETVFIGNKLIDNLNLFTTKRHLYETIGPIPQTEEKITTLVMDWT